MTASSRWFPVGFGLLLEAAVAFGLGERMEVLPVQAFDRRAGRFSVAG
jgi:hypothetical protein